jgi:hypothetical protein
MIQRIQSIFLALASLFTFGFFVVDAAETPTPVAGSEVFDDAQLTLFDSPLLIGAAIGSGLVLLIAIFMYRNRRLQQILCNVAILLAVAYLLYGGLMWYTDTAAEYARLSFGIALPILAIIFTALASKYIKKDERLVRSADRLR